MLLAQGMHALSDLGMVIIHARLKRPYSRVSLVCHVNVLAKEKRTERRGKKTPTHICNKVAFLWAVDS